VGGLTVLHECLVSLPEEDFVYLGDTDRFPYGEKSADELRDRSAAVAGYLLDRGTKLMVIACNSATGAARATVAELAGERGVPVVTVIDPEAEIAASITQSGRVGVLATPATVEGGAYARALDRHPRELEVTQVAAPDLAPIIQNGFPFDDGVMEAARSYVEPLKEADVDTLILGCTHYPLVAPMLQRMLGRDVRLVTAGHAVAANVQRVLEATGSLHEAGKEGDYRFLCTAGVESFRELGTRFLQMPLGDVEHVEID
jgi:glutamate racemase